LAAKPFHGVEVKLQSERLSKRSFLLSAGPLFDDSKACVGSIVTLTDITERKEAEEQQKMLVAELNHRVKNILAIVKSVASQTVRSSESLDHFATAFSGRVTALALAHDILTQTRWTGSGLGELLTAVLAPHHSADSQRVTIDGPTILLPARAVVPLSMAFHELATNAVKYGALSLEGGRIDITWRLTDDGQMVELIWSERGGPKVESGVVSGFGTQLIERVIAYELDGASKLDFDPLGLRRTLRFRIPDRPGSGAESPSSTIQ
jgi:two-component sensor histidine kinase